MKVCVHVPVCVCGLAFVSVRVCSDICEYVPYDCFNQRVAGLNLPVRARNKRHAVTAEQGVPGRSEPNEIPHETFHEL